MDPKDLDDYLEKLVRTDALPPPSADRYALIGLWTIAAFLFATLIVTARW